MNRTETARELIKIAEELVTADEVAVTPKDIYRVRNEVAKKYPHTDRLGKKRPYDFYTYNDKNKKDRRIKIEGGAPRAGDERRAKDVKVFKELVRGLKALGLDVKFSTQDNNQSSCRVLVRLPL